MGWQNRRGRRIRPRLLASGWEADVPLPYYMNINRDWRG